MIGFGLIALGMLLLALLPVLLALRRRDNGIDPAYQRLEAYRTRLDEIDDEAGAGVIAADQADSARREIEREMLAHVEPGVVPAAAAAPGHPVAAVVVTLCTGALALGIYFYGGRPDLVGADTSVVPPADVAAMIDKINEHLEKNPDDRQGWEMLGRAYMAMGRYAEAVPTFERLLALSGEADANALVRYADALAMAADGKLGGKPTELLNRVLAMEPENRTALWLAGMAAVERGDNAVAVDYWNRLLPLLKDQNTRDEVARLIEQAGGGAVENPAATAGTATIRMRVELAPALRDRVPADAVVFVTARAQQGPPMPLAVVKREASELPFDVTLDDTLAMAPDLRLSRHATAMVTARVSASGRAERESGDLIGTVQDVPTTGAEPLTLIIDSTVP